MPLVSEPEFGVTLVVGLATPSFLYFSISLNSFCILFSCNAKNSSCLFNSVSQDFKLSLIFSKVDLQFPLKFANSDSKEQIFACFSHRLDLSSETSLTRDDVLLSKSCLKIFNLTSRFSAKVINLSSSAPLLGVPAPCDYSCELTNVSKLVPDLLNIS